MRKYTKLFLATLCFISSAPVLADGYKGEAPPLVPVTIPNFNGGFEFTLGAIYMQPTSSNANYFGVHQDVDVTVSGGPTTVNHNWSDNAVDPGYDWGFVVGVGYVIPNTANDIKLDWMYFHNTFSDSTGLLGSSDDAITTDAVGFPGGDFEMTSGTALDASGKVQVDFDAVDLTFGQYINIGPRLQTRLFAGLRYMRLNDDLNTSYSFANPTGGTGLGSVETLSGSLNSSFNGLGPLFGLRADYYLGMGFGLSGTFDAALLVGEVSLSGNQSDVTENLTTGGIYNIVSNISRDYNWDSNDVVAPGFDSKFGLNYKYQFNNGTLLALELGYQVTKYIDVVQEMDRRDGSDRDRYDTDLTNFGLNGPYLTLNVKV